MRRLWGILRNLWTKKFGGSRFARVDEVLGNSSDKDGLGILTKVGLFRGLIVSFEGEG